MIHGHESGNKSALEIFPSILATCYPPDAVVFKKLFWPLLGSWVPVKWARLEFSRIEASKKPPF